MNSLSWFIYLTQIFSNFGVLFAFAMMSTFFILAIGIIVDVPESQYENGYKPSFRKFRKYSIIGIVIFGVLGAIMPSRETMVLIAASEVGEKIYQSDKAKAIIDPSVELLQEWIKKELTSLKEKGKIKDK